MRLGCSPVAPSLRNVLLLLILGHENVADLPQRRDPCGLGSDSNLIVTDCSPFIVTYIAPRWQGPRTTCSTPEIQSISTRRRDCFVFLAYCATVYAS